MIELTLPASPGIYRIVDVESGRFYIGSSVNVHRRWGQHVYRLQRGTHPNPILQSVWNVEPARLAITVSELLASEDKDHILRAEQAALDAAGVGRNRQCMNVLSMAGSHLGRKRTDETKARLANAQRGKSASAEAKAKMRAAKLGKPLSDEHRRKLGDAARGKKVNRPKGIYCHSLRALDADQVRALRMKRAGGMSWRQLAAEAGMKSLMAVKRAVLGITYGDVK